MGDHGRQERQEAPVRREALKASRSSPHFYGLPRSAGAQSSLFVVQEGEDIHFVNHQLGRVLFSVKDPKRCCIPVKLAWFDLISSSLCRFL